MSYLELETELHEQIVHLLKQKNVLHEIDLSEDRPLGTFVYIDSSDISYRVALIVRRYTPSRYSRSEHAEITVSSSSRAIKAIKYRPDSNGIVNYKKAVDRFVAAIHQVKNEVAQNSQRALLRSNNEELEQQEIGDLVCPDLMKATRDPKTGLYDLLLRFTALEKEKARKILAFVKSL